MKVQRDFGISAEAEIVVKNRQWQWFAFFIWA
jgi:hypothetical protein